ncbi:MAG TPA: serine/threonine-protein kinase [Myxococcales bacterium]|nr:serine/threonine-protein kinase [Myxococcales bacterium]
MTADCLSADEINDMAEGRLDAKTAGAAQLHVDGCSSCRKLVAAIAQSRTERSITDGGDASPGMAVRTMPVGKGTAIGRYVVSHLLGSGGMGAVYAGSDPELGRRVAIKLLHDGGTGPAVEGDGRLLHEARSMARLVHPNVVRIYDVGVHAQRPFIAMELVEGRTLRRWLLEVPRSTEEIVTAFVAAGRGLSAAHEAGLLHGDFKPDNVLVARDDRVEVGDFGLARPLDLSAAGASEPVGGTPAYLAPEVLKGLRPSAASDQFSFCVCLWEGLHGRRPFEGRTPEQLLEQVQARKALPASSGKVPARLRRLLLRGLDPDPSARHPSMAALLHAVDRRPRRTRMLVGVALAAGAALGLAFMLVRPTLERCSGARAELLPTWGEARRTALSSAFHARGQDAGWAVVDRALGRFGAAWVDVHTRSCRATRVEGHQSEDVLERRSRCLAHQREVVAALGDVWLNAPAELLAKAPLALASLPLPAACDGDALLNAERTPDPAPQIADKVPEVRLRLATVSARLAAGDASAALALAREASRDSRALDYAPLEAEALLELSLALQQHGDLDEAEQTFRDAMLAAAVARHEQVLAESLVLLARLVGVTRARLDDGEILLSRAAPAVARLGDLKLGSDLEMLRGSLRLDRGDAEGARAIFSAQLPVLELILGKDHPAVGELHHSLFLVAHRLGHNEEARAQAEAALRVLERALPPHHPKIGSAVMDLATTEAELGNLASAHGLFERAVLVAEKNQGPEGPTAAGPLANLASVLGMEGDLSGAHAAMERALRISTATRGPRHPLTAHLELTLGDLDWKAGSVAGALDHLGRAAELREQQFGRHHADTAEVLAILGRARIDAGEPDGLALVLEADALVRELSPNARRRAHTAGHACEALLEAGRPEDAAPHCERMLAAAREEWPAERPGAIEALSLATELDLARGAGAARRADLEQGLVAMEKLHGAWPRVTIAARFALAGVLAGDPDPAIRSRSTGLARAALDSARRLGTRQRRLLAMDAFLARAKL